jgi:hypothetical protein
LLTLPQIHDVRPIKLPSDHSGPHYKKGSLEVSYRYVSLPHHEPVVLDWLVVGIPEPGSYDICWTIGARNLPSLEEGTLQLKVEYDEPSPEPICTIGALTRARHPAA